MTSLLLLQIKKFSAWFTTLIVKDIKKHRGEHIYNLSYVTHVWKNPNIITMARHENVW